jgi:hypothetical protein
MSTMEMVRQTVITPQLATAASMLVRMAHPGDASLHRALEKAEARLMTQPWRVDDGVLHIVSFSHQNEVQLTDGADCSCPATKGVCWHAAAWRILSTLAAAGLDPVADLPLAPAEDTLPASSFLDGPFDAFEDVELTAPEPVAPVAPKPFKPGKAITHEPEPGSDFARLTAEMDRLFAA